MLKLMKSECNHGTGTKLEKFIKKLLLIDIHRYILSALFQLKTEMP